MTKTIALTHDDRMALRTAIDSPLFKKSFYPTLHERVYKMHWLEGRDSYCIIATNDGHRIISHRDTCIADTKTMGNNLIARMDVDNYVSDVIDAYSRQLTQRVYGN